MATQITEIYEDEVYFGFDLQDPLNLRLKKHLNTINNIEEHPEEKINVLLYGVENTYTVNSRTPGAFTSDTVFHSLCNHPDVLDEVSVRRSVLDQMSRAMLNAGFSFEDLKKCIESLPTNLLLFSAESDKYEVVENALGGKFVDAFAQFCWSYALSILSLTQVLELVQALMKANTLEKSMGNFVSVAERVAKDGKEMPIEWIIHL